VVDNDTHHGLDIEGTTVNSDKFLAELREHRLTAYQAVPADIREHYALEAEIAQNYRGRFVYELLQNADDAMAEGGLDDAVRIVLTNDALLVANSGRPISERDVNSLCAESAENPGHPPAIAGESRLRSACGPARAGLMTLEKRRANPGVERRMGGGGVGGQTSSSGFTGSGSRRWTAWGLTGMRSLDARMPSRVNPLSRRLRCDT